MFTELVAPIVSISYLGLLILILSEILLAVLGRMSVNV